MSLKYQKEIVIRYFLSSVSCVFLISSFKMKISWRKKRKRDMSRMLATFFRKKYRKDVFLLKSTSFLGMGYKVEIKAVSKINYSLAKQTQTKTACWRFSKSRLAKILLVICEPRIWVWTKFQKNMMRQCKHDFLKENKKKEKERKTYGWFNGLHELESKYGTDSCCVCLGQSPSSLPFRERLIWIP